MKPNVNKPGSYGLGVQSLYGIIGHGGDWNNAYTSVVGRYRGYDWVILVNGQVGDATEKTSGALPILRKVIEESEL